MSFTQTTNYGLYKPTINSDNDQWGNHLNSNADTLDATIKTIANSAGVVSWNTRSGVVTLSNADVVAVLPGSSTLPSMDSTATVGTGTTWARADHVHPVDTTRAPLASPVFTGDARAVTPAAGDNDTSVATSAFVQAAQRYTNYVDNSGFSVNQRIYVSGTALGVGVYGHDRWKGGAAGGTYTFTAAPPSTTITITAGTLQQVIEGASVVGGNYMLSWTGTAQGRVGAGSYAASPVVVSGATAGANLTIEFNAGTLAQVKLEPGGVVTPWVANRARDELSNCQRFYCLVPVHALLSTTVAAQYVCMSGFTPVAMRATPASLTSQTINADTNLSGFTLDNGFPGGFRAFGTSTASGVAAFDRLVACSADL